MKFLHRTSTKEPEDTLGDDIDTDDQLPKGYTPGKGRATPSRAGLRGEPGTREHRCRGRS